MKTEERNKLKEIYLQLEGVGLSPEERAKDFDAMSDSEVFNFKVDWMFCSVPTVKDLRNQGVRVKVVHSRRIKGQGIKKNSEWRDLGEQPCNYEPRGGQTEVFLELSDGSVYSGSSKCSRGDNFDRKVGLAFAISKALNSIPE